MKFISLQYTVFEALCIMYSAKGFMNNLESILARKAMISNIFNNIRSEISTERLFVEMSTIVPYHHHANDFTFIAVLSVYIYGKYKYSISGEREQYAKLKKIDKYNMIYNIYRRIFVIFIFIFFKDVESVF